MEYLNALFDYQNSMQRNALYEEELIKDFILLTAPLAPHMSEELWEYIGCPYSVHNQRFPKYDETKLVFGTIDIAVQINGRLRDVITVHRDATEDEIKQSALSSEKIQAFANEQQVIKFIFIKGRLINIIS